MTPLERDLRIFQDPDLLFKICQHVASGGSIITLSELWQINFGTLMGWIRMDKEREAKYNQAIQDRKEYSLERVLHELTAIGTTEPGEVIRASDKIKALELVGKTVAAFTDRVEETKTIRLEDIVVASMKVDGNPSKED